MLIDNTPLETYTISGIPILVKREDLCCPYPGPSFSKMRGVVAHIRNRPESTIGVLDTVHSKAGWAVAWACHHLGKQSINYWPLYKDQKIPKQQQLESQKLGASWHTLQAGRSCILYHKAKKQLIEIADSYMMPNALKLPESVTENALEAQRTIPQLPEEGTIVISISSGTVAAGILKGLWDTKLNFLLHMGYSRSEFACRQYISEKANLVCLPSSRVQIIDEGYSYADQTCVKVPFPSNPFYDAKAWAWLEKYAQELQQPVVMWNIGS